MDQYYIEEGYYTPEKGYFVYIAVAEAQPSSSFTISAIGSELADANISISAVATFSAQIDRFRDVDSAITSAATQTALVGKIQEAQADFGALFTPSIIADVVINQTATLDSVSTMSVDTAVNRSATIALANIGNLNSQADKFVGYDSLLSSVFSQTADANYTAENQGTFTATASQTATVNRQAEGQSTLSSSFTQTTDSIILTLAQASMTARANVFASRYLGSGRPRRIEAADYQYLEEYFSSTIKQFGTHSLSPIGNTTSILGQIPNVQGTIPKPNESWAMEFWLRPPTNPTQRNTIFYSSNSFFLLRLNATRTLTYRDLAKTGADYTTSALTANQFNHVLIAYSSGYLAVWVNGSRQIYIDQTAHTSTEWGGRLTTNTFRLSLAQNTYVDDLSFHRSTTLGYSPSSTSISVPTARRENDPATTQFLYHFDNDDFDDISLAQTGQATLSSNFTQTTSAQKVINALSNQSSAFTSNVVGYKIVDIQSLLASESAINAINSRTRDFDSTTSSEFTQVCVIDKIVEFASDLSSECLITADVTRIKQFAINLTDAFTPTIEVNAQRAGIALLETTAQLTANISYQADTQASISANSQLSATITHTISFVSDLSSQSTTSIVGQRVRFVDSALQSQFAVNADNIRVRTLNAACETTGQLTVDAFRIKQFASALATTLTTQNTINVVRDAVSAMSASFSQSTANVRVRTTSSDVTAQFTQTTAAVKTPGIAVDMSAVSAVTAFVIKTVDAIPQLGSIATQLSVAAKNATGTITLESRFTQTANVGLIKTLDGVGTVASTGVQIYSVREATLGPQGQGIFDNFYQLERNATISFWAKRNLNTFGTQIIFGTEFEQANRTRLLFDYYYNNSMNRFENVIKWDYFAGGGAASWVFANSIDNEWHHFLLRMNDNTTGGTAFRWWDLWVDGVYISQQRNSTLNNVPFISDDYLALGFSIPFGTDPDPARLDGSLAQIWIGDTRTGTPYNYTFSAQDFYNNGPVDFGANGTRNGLLPPPAIYNLLSDPWTAVTFAEYTDAQKPAPEPLVFNGLRARFNTEAIANQRVVAVGILNSTSAMSVTGFKITENPVALTAEAALTCNLIHVKGLSGAVTSAFSQTAQINVITGNVIAASMTAQMSVSSGFEIQASALLQSLATLEIDATQILPIRTEAFLSSNFVVSADVNAFTGFEISVTAQSQITCAFDVIPPTRAQAALTSTFAVTATIGSIEQFAVLNISDISVTVSARRIRSIQSQLQTRATLTSVIGKITGLVSTRLSAEGFQLTAGDVINIDPALTYVVPPETRSLMIRPEDREYQISGETRVYKLI